MESALTAPRLRRGTVQNLLLLTGPFLQLSLRLLPHPAPLLLLVLPRSPDRSSLWRKSARMSFMHCTNVDVNLSIGDVNKSVYLICYVNNCPLLFNC